MTYNVFSGTLNPAQSQSISLGVAYPQSFLLRTSGGGRP